jgi:hypothetical protein
MVPAVWIRVAVCVNIGGRDTCCATIAATASAIIDAAERVIREDTVHDIDCSQTSYGVRSAGCDGMVITFAAVYADELDGKLVRRLSGLPEPSAAAVLCAGRSTVTHYLHLLHRAGLPAQDLEDYDPPARSRLAHHREKHGSSSSTSTCPPTTVHYATLIPEALPIPIGANEPTENFISACISPATYSGSAPCKEPGT